MMNSLFPSVPDCFDGIRVMVNKNHPREFSHWETMRWKAHPFICWLAKWLPITPYVEGRYARDKDSDLLMDTMRGIVYCSPAQAAALRRETTER